MKGVKILILKTLCVVGFYLFISIFFLNSMFEVSIIPIILILTFTVHHVVNNIYKITHQNEIFKFGHTITGKIIEVKNIETDSERGPIYRHTVEFIDHSNNRIVFQNPVETNKKYQENENIEVVYLKDSNTAQIKDLGLMLNPSYLKIVILIFAATFLITLILITKEGNTKIDGLSVNIY